MINHECYECGFSHDDNGPCESPRTVMNEIQEGHGQPIKTKGVIHWHDAKSGDGMLKIDSVGLVRFVCHTVGDLSQGETVPVILHYDMTFIQAEIDTAKL